MGAGAMLCLMGPWLFIHEKESFLRYAEYPYVTALIAPLAVCLFHPAE